MGASQSQDSELNVENNNIVHDQPKKAQENNVPVRPIEKTPDPKLVVHSKPSKQTQKIQLPYNYEAILKDADSPVDMSSMDHKLLSQLHSGVFLNQKKKKYWVDKNNKNCFMLFARDLSISWAENSSYWHWSYQKETTTSEAFIEIAELVQVCWLELSGKFDVSKLSPGTLYEVVLIVMLKEQAYGWDAPVNFRLTLPKGQKIERKETLVNKPRGHWIEVPFGDFKTSFENGGELDIYFHEYDAGEWKTGLIVKGVAIRPKN